MAGFINGSEREPTADDEQQDMRQEDDGDEERAATGRVHEDWLQVAGNDFAALGSE